MKRLALFIVLLLSAVGLSQTRTPNPIYPPWDYQNRAIPPMIYFKPDGSDSTVGKWYFYNPVNKTDTLHVSIVNAAITVDTVIIGSVGLTQKSIDSLQFYDLLAYNQQLKDADSNAVQRNTTREIKGKIDVLQDSSEIGNNIARIIQGINANIKKGIDSVLENNKEGNYLLQRWLTTISAGLTMIFSQAGIDSIQNVSFWITNFRARLDSILENNKENNTLTQANRVLLTTTITRLDSILANITENNTLTQSVLTAENNRLNLAKTDSIITSFTTLTTETDSITLPANKFVSIFVKSIDDTIQVAFNRSFTNPDRYYPTMEGYIVINLDTSLCPKAYIKQYSAGTVSGTANYGIRIEKSKL